MHSNLIGLSKYARLAEWIVIRPQILEEAVTQIADLLISLRRNVQKLSAARAKPAGKPRAAPARPPRSESRVYAGSPSWSVPAVHD